MKIKTLQLENFRAKTLLSIDFGLRLTVLMGENGSGKTTILDGLAIALGVVPMRLPGVAGINFKKRGDIRQVEGRVAPYTRVALETIDGLVWDRMQKRDQSRTTAKSLPSRIGTSLIDRHIDEWILDPHNRGDTFDLPVFVFYGVSRALLDLPQNRKGFPKAHDRFEALAGALTATTRFKSAFVWFYNKENEEIRLQRERKSFDFRLKELDAVRSAMTRMFADISDPQVKLNPLRLTVQHGGQTLDIAQLSDGYKTLLGLVIDLSARMAIANPHFDDPLSAEAVVMIDEVDLHLHPAWQRRIIGDLLATFPNTQFILTTHSPYVVGSINNHLKRDRIKKRTIDDPVAQKLLALDPSQVAAYLMQKGHMESLLDQDRGLIDDRLLEQFNAMARVYETMRDIEWAHKA
jgi:predicted ATP-binding protein involved in virulence